MGIDSRKVILEVKKHPCIHDQSCEDFGNRIVKMNAWMEITKAIFGDDFHKMGDVTRNNVCLDVQKRWRHLRDSYVKSGKLKKNRPYIFAEEMSFLKNYKVEQWGDKICNAKNKMDGPNSPVDPAAAPKSGDSRNHKRPVQTCGLPPDTLSARKGRKPGPGGITEFEKMLLNVVKSNVERAPNPPDPDEMFFLSQMPHIKALSHSDLLDFKCKFMDLLKSYTDIYD